MHNSPVKTTARYLPGSPCYSQASEVAMEPEKKENEENENKEEEQEEEEQQPLEKPASKAQRQEANPRCQRHHQRLSKGKNRCQRPKPKEVPRTKRRRHKRRRKKRGTKRKTPLHLSKGLLPKVVPETKSPSSSLGCQKRKKRFRRLSEKKKKKKKKK